MKIHLDFYVCGGLLLFPALIPIPLPSVKQLWRGSATRAKRYYHLRKKAQFYYNKYYVLSKKKIHTYLIFLVPKFRVQNTYFLYLFSSSKSYACIYHITIKYILPFSSLKFWKNLYFCYSLLCCSVLFCSWGKNKALISRIFVSDKIKKKKMVMMMLQNSKGIQRLFQSSTIINGSVFSKVRQYIYFFIYLFSESLFLFFFNLNACCIWINGFHKED